MSKKLKRISEHVWIYPLDTPKDRPNLGYVLGETSALAVDAGHSSSHVQDFYNALRKESLPLPDLTVITHWHWDHTFGMHAVHGKTLALPETNRQLNEIRKGMEEDPSKVRRFLNSDPSIRKEYAGNVPVAVVPSDDEITADQEIDLGGVKAELIISPSPHTDDALLVFVPEDKALFVGDAQLGEFPSWRMDRKKMAAFTEKVLSIDADIVVDGHWMPETKESFLEGLL